MSTSLRSVLPWPTKVNKLLAISFVYFFHGLLFISRLLDSFLHNEFFPPNQTPLNLQFSHRIFFLSSTIVPNSYAATGIRTHISAVELHQPGIFRTLYRLSYSAAGLQWKINNRSSLLALPSLTQRFESQTLVQEFSSLGMSQQDWHTLCIHTHIFICSKDSGSSLLLPLCHISGSTSNSTPQWVSTPFSSLQLEPPDVALLDDEARFPTLHSSFVHQCVFEVCKLSNINVVRSWQKCKLNQFEFNFERESLLLWILSEHKNKNVVIEKKSNQLLPIRWDWDSMTGEFFRQRHSKVVVGGMILHEFVFEAVRPHKWLSRSLEDTFENKLLIRYFSVRNNWGLFLSILFPAH